MNDKYITTILNGKLTELTEEKTKFLLEYRMSSKEEKARIKELIENAKSK